MAVEKVKKYDHEFRCTACNKNWTIVATTYDAFSVHPNFCPQCGARKMDGKIEHVFSPPPRMVDSLDGQRKANMEHSRYAHQLASDFSRAEPQEEMVTIQAPQGGAGRYGRSREVIPKRIVDSIEQKIGNVIESQ